MYSIYVYMIRRRSSTWHCCSAILILLPPPPIYISIMPHFIARLTLNYTTTTYITHNKERKNGIIEGFLRVAVRECDARHDMRCAPFFLLFVVLFICAAPSMSPSCLLFYALLTYSLTLWCVCVCLRHLAVHICL